MTEKDESVQYSNLDASIGLVFVGKGHENQSIVEFDVQEAKKESF